MLERKAGSSEASTPASRHAACATVAGGVRQQTINQHFAQQVTQQVTQRITQQITLQVTQQLINQQVTQQLAQEDRPSRLHEDAQQGQHY